MSSQPSRKPNSRGGGRGGGRSGGRGGGRGRNNNHRSSGGRGGLSSNMTNQQPDEDVLIEFMPYMRNQHPTALKIHQVHGDDETAFVRAAREFLRAEKSGEVQKMMEKLAVEDDPIVVPAAQQQRKNTVAPIARSPPRSPVPPSNGMSPLPPGFHAAPPGLQQQQQHGMSPARPMMPQYSHQQQHHGSPTPPPGMMMQQQQRGGMSPPRPMMQQQGGPPGMPVQQQQAGRSPMRMQQMSPQQYHGSPAPPGMPPSMHPQQQERQQQQQQSPMGMMQPPPPRMQQQQQQQQQRQGASPMPPPNTMQPPLMGISSLPPGLQQPSALKSAAPGVSTSPQQNKVGNWHPNAPGTPDAAQQPPQPDTPIPAPPETPSKPTRPVWQPKRIWTRLDEQPGRIFANNGPGDGPMIQLRPRQELTAKWVLPLKYLRQRMQEKERAGATIRDALQELTVGLFRRGCTENGTNASIISKEILAPSTENRNDYPFQIDQRSDCVFGTVPFYAPRTPGHVLFRLYWQDEPLYTLATGPTLFVRVSEEDFESTMRFILSNFKSRKGSATSLSSLNALATVLEQFRPSNTGKNSGNSNRRNNNNNNNGGGSGWDSAGRAAWGCICESRKVLEVCASEHLKGKEKLRKLEEEVEELKVLVEEEEQVEQEAEDDDGELSPTQAKLKEKTHALMGGRASNDRKWKDSQVSFANILKAVVLSPNASLLFRRDLIAKIRLEFELWCSLVDAFAPSPFNTDKESLCVNFNDFPQHVTPSHYQQCAESRQKMQKDMLGFVPNKKTLQEALFKSSENSNQQVMDRSVVDSFNKLSSAMGKLYEDVYMVSDRILQQREMVRSHLENIVAQCGDAFPPGTRVMIFGSSANGFGSPSSDLDMCLQIPPNTKLPGGDEDPTGALAMGKLAEALENSGMKNVDTVRLTARIPIIMFNCPRPMGQEGESELMECDLSFLNSLAVLNTSLLLSYSRIHPVTRVLASLIKRWAKARDINNPSKHTLSSYGYIIMLLHFLTYHRRKGNGLIASMETERTSNNPVTFGPLLPNLQRMDPAWLATPVGQHPYAELERLPQQLMKHPLEEKMVVNTYFHRIKNQQELTELQTRFPSQDLSLAIMLASFFRYYAFEFDYKRHVVSMNSTIKRGMVEREIKAETHAWKVYSTGLAIEDPFETFYDIAHVVKGGNFHRLRNELALAYTKIINAVESGSIEGMDLIDLICEPIEKEDEAA